MFHLACWDFPLAIWAPSAGRIELRQLQQQRRTGRPLTPTLAARSVRMICWASPKSRLEKKLGSGQKCKVSFVCLPLSLPFALWGADDSGELASVFLGVLKVAASDERTRTCRPLGKVQYVCQKTVRQQHRTETLRQQLLMVLEPTDTIHPGLCG